MRVQDRHERLQFPGTEPRLETLDRLRRQRNFRHQHDGAFPLLQRVRDGLQINFGLAGAGNAVKQKCAAGLVLPPGFPVDERAGDRGLRLAARAIAALIYRNRRLARRSKPAAASAKCVRAHTDRVRKFPT